MDHQGHDSTPYLDSGLAPLQRTGHAQALVHEAKRAANVVQPYQSPLALVRLVTQLPWQQPSDVPASFLEELTTESGPSSTLASHGWSLNGAAVRQDAPGELVLDLLKCAFAMDDAYGPDERQAIAHKTTDSEAPHQQEQEARTGPEVQATSSSRSALRFSRPTSASMPATSPNLILHTCTTSGAVKAYRYFMNGGTSSPGTDDANAPFCPSMLMTRLHQASHASARKGLQVLLQEETDLYLMQHKGAKEQAPGSSPFSNSYEQPTWSHTLLDPSVPLPGLLNLATQPNIVGVAPRCVASNGLSPVKLSLYGMYIQGGKVTARCAGRYLHTSWRTHQSGRVTSRVQLARWHRKRSNSNEDNDDKDELELNMEMESEVVILDPPASGLIALECRQGYLVSKPAFLLIVPATHNLSRELTSGLACPPAPLGVFSRSSTQKDMRVSSTGEDGADGLVLSDEEAKERIMSQVRSQQKDRHMEVVKDSIARDMGSFFQFMHLMRRQLGLESRLDLPPASSNRLAPVLGPGTSTSNLSSGRSSSGFPKDTPRAGTPRASVTNELMAFQPTPQSSPGPGGLRALVPGRHSGLHSVRLPSLHETSTPSVDLTPQLSLMAVKSHVHMGNMVSLGVRLLQLACEMAWPYTARTILTGLMDMGLNFHDIEAQASQDGMSFLHRTVRSRNAGMVAEVGVWAEAANRTLDWGVADADGVTPLHLAACLEDGGLLGIHILRKWPAAGQLWLTKETHRDKLTPQHMAEAAGNEFLNRMADMAGLLNCQSCTEMACAMRTPLPGQLVTDLPMGAAAEGHGAQLEEQETGSPKKANSGDTGWAGSTDTLHPVPSSLSAAPPSTEQHDPRAFMRPAAVGSLPTVPERNSAERSGSMPLETSGVNLCAAGSGTSRMATLPLEKGRPSPAWGEGAGDSAGAVHTQASSSSAADVLPAAAVPGASHHALHAQGPSSHSAVPSVHPLGQQHHQQQHQHQQAHSSKHSRSASSGSSVQFLAASKPIGVGKPLREACCGDESSAAPAGHPVVAEADSPPTTRPKKRMGLCGLF